ncbi:hypothetical protein CTEN210_16622 [Chaetoceros tenuissimus]|uniref:Cytochrome b5 heme-binding domain-containing protein n=1 Tax=Chaetoceros tenuissimus TaxID=426638 RepID=A0AAD3D948_9STRA|nr:hypothetical protein CTEN210_16622 [Chaetoceros tenuissimus]
MNWFILLPFFSWGLEQVDAFNIAPQNVVKQRKIPSNQMLKLQNAFGSKRIQLQTSKSTTTQLNLDLNPPIIAGGAVALFGIWLYIDGYDARERNRQNKEYEAQVKAIEEERARLAYIKPKDYWTEDELKQYDGSLENDPEQNGPILMAANGKVFNVYKGRNFYGPGGEYQNFAGRDATRLLAKTQVEEESEEEMKKPLNMGQRATLQGWMWTLESKYDIVGELEGFDSDTTSTKAVMTSDDEVVPPPQMPF